LATKKLIAVKEFCLHHRISSDFIFELHRNEMVELVTIKRTSYIAEKNLHDIERMTRLYNELQVNIEGIQTIFHLLTRIEKKDAELQALRDQLAFYSTGE